MKLKIMSAKRFVLYPYSFINFNNTKQAYKLLDNKRLIEQQRIYKMFNLFSKNQAIGQKLITSFMNIKPPILYPIAQNTLFKQFCGGEDLDSLTPVIKPILNEKVTPMLNYGVEYSTDEEDLEKGKNEMIDMINYLDDNKKGELKGQVILRVTGVMSCERLEKKQNNKLLSRKENELWKRDMKRMEAICEQAVHKKVKLLFDAETSEIQDIIHNLSIKMMQRFNGNKPRIYGTIQFYRKDSHKQLNDLIQNGKDNNYIPGLKLVRGAYMYDELLAGKRYIIHDTKSDTDKSYNDGVTKCIHNLDNMAVCFAGHNTETVKHILATLECYNIEHNHPNILLAQMYGMRNDITFNLKNVNVSQFIPYGGKEFLFPYLVRRGIENSSALGGSKEEVVSITNEIARRRTDIFY